MKLKRKKMTSNLSISIYPFDRFIVRHIFSSYASIFIYIHIYGKNCFNMLCIAVHYAYKQTNAKTNHSRIDCIHVFYRALYLFAICVFNAFSFVIHFISFSFSLGYVCSQFSESDQLHRIFWRDNGLCFKWACIEA